MTSGSGQPEGKATDWSPPTPNRHGLVARRAPRVPFFDRPKAPRDWRWVVGGAGRILIATGLLMFAFVGYQLWGTGIQTAQAQDRLKDQFRHQLQATTTTSEPATPDTSATGTEPTETTIPIAPDHGYSNGDAVAILKIPKIGIDDMYVVQGVRYNDLKNGPGHFKETPMPGQLGNAAIAGHRTTWGHPFFDLDKLGTGDLITVVTVDGTYVYQVTSTEVVDPSEYAKVIPTTDPTVATLTLTTCHPAYTARQRLIIHSVLLEGESDPVMRPSPTAMGGASDGLPGEGQGEDIPGDSTPIDSTPDTAPSTGSTVVDSVPGSATPTPSTTVDVSGQPQQSDDAFAQGWFADTSAIPQALGWGFVLLSVTVGAYYTGKAARRLYVCFLVGAIPFVLVLYFFFENVNRLLPPGL